MTGELTTIAMLAITAGASIYVAWPLLMGHTRAEEYLGTKPEETILQRLTVQRDSTYTAMKELEFDLAMGNLSQEDFQPLYDRYKRRAVAILKRIDDVTAGRASPKDVLAEIDEERGWPQETSRPVARTSSAGSDLDVEQEIQAFRSQSGRQKSNSAAAATCPSCGQQVSDPDAAFCAKCGAALKKANRGGRK